MAITYGFFNSLNGDRVYNADQMSEYFKGLITPNGVYESIGGAMQVMASTTPDMNVNVQSGRAIINSKWVENDAVEILPITAAHVTLNRWTAVVIQLDVSNREISIITVDGTPASSPTKPTLTNSATIKQMCLAYVYVAAGATSITQANITDTRANTSLCGWVTGLVEQVDTSTLFEQWETAYNENIEEMESWETTQQAAFNAWFSTLTSQLTVGAYIEQYQKVVEIGASDSKIIPLDMTGYTYDASDIFTVILNGLVATEAYDYLLDTSKTPVEMHVNLVNATDELVDIRVLKSQLGTAQMNT